MKKNYVALLTLLLQLGVNQNVFSSLSSGPRSVGKTKLDGQEVEIAARSIETVTTTPLTFEPSVFQAANFFYLGAVSQDPLSYALSRVYLGTSCQDETIITSLNLGALAPQKAFVNKKQDECKSDNEKTDNPLYNATIAHLALSGAYPIVVPTTGGNQTIVMVLDTARGEFVLKNTEALKDAGGNQTGGISGIAGNASTIFAAVNHTGEGAFGGDDSGIAIVKSTGTELEPGDTVSVKTAAGSDPADISLDDSVSLYWDGQIRRLFVGLQGETTAIGAFFSGVLVGRFEGENLILEPVVPASAVSGTDKIVAIAQQGTTIAIHNVKTMYTSTGKLYLIVNNSDQVFALPLMHQEFSDGDFASNNKDLIGKLAQKGSISQEDAATTPADLLTSSDAAAKVGQADTPGAQDVNNMFVLGDALYICTAQGMFQSSAVFDEDGLIRDWTPWQRVMGAVDPVMNGFIDLDTCQYWYLTQTTNAYDTVKVTLWSQNDTNLLGNLQKKLVETFPQDTGGVHQLFNFDEKTPSFDVDEFSMMVATGYQKVALIRTGKDDGGFVPTSGTDFSTNIDDNVKVFNDAALKTIGPICCAAVSLSPDENEGWLFVGGYGGVAVLSDGSGDGWTALDDLNDLANFTFKTVGNFSRVHKLVCDDEYVYVLTPGALYRVDMITLDSTIIAQPATLPSCTACDSLLDFILIDDVGVLGTTSGLYRTSGSSWSEIKTASVYSLGPVTHLSMRSLSKGSFAGGGNLYAVSANMTNHLTTIVRFNVESGNIEPITERKSKSSDPTRNHYYAFGELRTAMVSDGTFGFHSLPKHFGRTNYGRKINLTSTQFGIRVSDKALPLRTGSSAHNAGIPVQNTASGAWIIPGDWGIRVNE